jgi:hypothetical protein
VLAAVNATSTTTIAGKVSTLAQCKHHVMPGLPLVVVYLVTRCHDGWCDECALGRRVVLIDDKRLLCALDDHGGGWAVAQDFFHHLRLLAAHK